MTAIRGECNLEWFSPAPTRVDVEEFFTRHLIYPGLITDTNISFAILISSPLYTLYAGPQAFVEAALGMPLKTAAAEFRSFIELRAETAPWVADACRAILNCYEM